MTIIFPPFNKGTYTLIIYILKGAFKLAKALFKSKITRGIKFYYIIVGNSPSLTILFIEFALRDIKNNTLREIFVPKVYIAITNSLDLDHSLAVSMTIKEGGMSIKIFLDPIRGYDLARVLYS